MSDRQKALLSVVIPVHNGEKYIKRTVRNILKQTYRNVEIILVENNSRDTSWNVVCELQRLDARVRAVKSDTLGTSLARRRGVEEATGKYIVFSDQDDRYFSRNSLSIMVEAIETDGSQICQFNHYVKYRFGLWKKKAQVKNNTILSREQLMKTEIGGILGTEQSSMFNSVVWNKIYDSAMLKAAVKNIDVSLYFAEDVYLNFWAFTNENTQVVSARTAGVYIWSSGVGFSSSKDSAEALFRDYELIKPTMLSTLEEYGVDERVIWNNHVETLYAIRAYVQAASQNGVAETYIIDQLKIFADYEYVKNAKKWVYTSQNMNKWEELMFMAGDHTVQEYYDRFAKQ